MQGRLKHTRTSKEHFTMLNLDSPGCSRLGTHFMQTYAKGETIRRVLMDKQSRSFPKPHGEKNLTCKRNKHAKLQKGMKPFSCTAYNRGENTMVYHQGKIYFVSEEKSESWLQYTTSEITRG